MLTSLGLGEGRRTRRSRNRGRRSVSTGTVSNGNSASRTDQLALTQKIQESNPYEGVSPSFSRVTVDAWGKGENSTVLNILYNQGYTKNEIYGKTASGKTLLQEVQEKNSLRDVNLVHPGQVLKVPSRQAAEQQEQQTVQQPPAQQEQQTTQQPPAETQQQTPPPVSAEQGQNEQPEARVNSVKVDPWGKGPNSSLGAILRDQGFDEREIYREDANGDSILKQVARANGVHPDRIRAGQSLQIPNSREALGQMEIPEMPRPTPQTEAPARTEPTTTSEEPARNEPPAGTETPIQTEQPAQTGTPAPVQGNQNDGQEEVTANMGNLLSGVKENQFTRQEFQYLNARSSRYAQMRARFSNDGYSNDELRELGRMERRYGVEYARLAASDDVALPSFPASSNDPDLAIQVKHYHESGPLFDRYKNGSATTEDALSVMVRQRDEARRQETN